MNASSAQISFRERANRPVIGALVVIVPLALFLASLWPAMHSLWIDSYIYTHGYLVLAISVWLVVREIRRQPLEAFAPSLLGLLVLGAMIAMALVGRAADILLFQELAVPGLVLGALVAAGGWTLTKRFLAPVGYMIFAVNIWGVLNSPLQQMTTVVVSFLARAASIPAYVEDNVVHIPSGSFEIGGGCSGLHYLIVACALSTLYGLLNYRRWVNRAIALSTAIIFALVTNWIRVFTIILAGHMTDMQHFLITVDHYYYGWVLFFIVTSPLMYLGGYLERTESRP